MSRKSLLNEIIDYLYEYKESSKTDKHFNDGVFSSTRSAVQYALNNAIGHIKTIKETRDWGKIDKQKKLKRKKKK